MNKEKWFLAKELFYKYKGNIYQMKRDEVYEQYKQSNISADIESQWIAKKMEMIKNELEYCVNNKNLAELYAEYGHYTLASKIMRD